VTTFDLEAGAFTLALGPADGVTAVDLVWELGTHDHEGEETAEGEHAHAHGSEDPHFWTDPVAMREVVEALGPVLGELGVDVADREADLSGRLEALDAQVREILAVIPEDGRKLVTGHESMGYFADEYGFELVGAVIPGLSSQGEVSAQELAALADQIQEQGVSVIFTEIGTPQSVVEAIAGETGATIVELPSHNLPEDGSYATFVLDIANLIAGALAA
jgi:zinc/manganese transport system substrate-binding protein